LSRDIGWRGCNAARERAVGEVQREGSELDRPRFRARRARRVLRRLAAQHGVDARHELSRIERLREVVVGANLEAHDAVDVIALRGEHDDRDVVGALAQAPADGEAVFARQHEVEHHQVVAYAREASVHGLRIGHRLDRETLLGQITLEKIAQAQVVVDDEDLLAGVRLHDSMLAAARAHSASLQVVTSRRLPETTSRVDRHTLGLPVASANDPILKGRSMKYVAILTALGFACAAAIAAAAPEGHGHDGFKAADTNGDGKISREEAKAHPRLAKHFDEIDADHDGQITADEMRAYHEKVRAEHWKKLDTNGDGKISREEAKAHPRLAERFDQLDTDKDGFLSPDELKAAHGKRHTTK
jgi:Ca2+-binding EF-hand superfamily protein